jgi:hypothetical protein
MLIPRNHARKIWPRFAGAILRGEKAFELRQEDRARFAPGDLLELLEWCPQVEKYSGLVLRFGVASVLRDVPGVVEGFAVLSLGPCDVSHSFPLDGCTSLEMARYGIRSEEVLPDLSYFEERRKNA